jgi:hypothetical protein
MRGKDSEGGEAASAGRKLNRGERTNVYLVVLAGGKSRRWRMWLGVVCVGGMLRRAGGLQILKDAVFIPRSGELEAAMVVMYVCKQFLSIVGRAWRRREEESVRQRRRKKRKLAGELAKVMGVCSKLQEVIFDQMRNKGPCRVCGGV